MKAGLLVFLLFASMAAFSQNPVINEVCYVNRLSLTSIEGKSPDWIEIYNPGPGTINMNGFYLSDKSDNPLKWRFPEYLIEPGSFLIVFASDDDKVENGEMHTNFSLSLMEDNLYLFSSSTWSFVDSVVAECAPADHSLGCIADGSFPRGVFTAPTPGRSNTGADTTIIDFHPDSLSLSHIGGFYEDPFYLQLFNSNSENSIYYTLDCNEPDDRANLYDSPVYIYDRSPEPFSYSGIETGLNWKEPTSNMFKASVIRAVVMSGGCPASPSITCTFFVNKEMKSRYPVYVFSLSMNPKDLFGNDEGMYVYGNNENCLKKSKKYEKDAHVEVFSPTGEIIISQNVTSKIQGRGSRSRPQKSVRIYAKEKYGTDYFNHAFFPDKSIDRYKRLALRGVFGDHGRTLFTDDICHTLSSGLNIDYMATTPVVVFLEGEYWGIHNLREINDRYYIEANHGITDEIIDIISHEGIDYLFADDGNLDSYNELISILETLDMSDSASYSQINEIIDIDNSIDFFITQIYFSNTDFPAANSKLWKPRNDNSKWRWFLFDFDAVMVRPNFNQIFEYINDDRSVDISPEWSLFVFKKLLKNSAYKNKFYLRFLQLLGSTFSTQNVLNKIDEFEKKYEPLVAEHVVRWHYPADVNTWKYHVSQMKNAALQRAHEIAEQLNASFGNPFIICPNPSSVFFTVSFFDKIYDYCRIKIYSVKGEPVFYGVFTPDDDSSMRIEHGLGPGIYIVEVELYGRLYHERIIVV